MPIFKSKFSYRQRRSQSGVTLIEVMVSVLLLSLALLGMAALQAGSLSKQTSALARGNSAGLISDITDRMRANLSRAPGYDTSVATPTFTINQTWAAQQTATFTISKNCLTTSCNAAEREEFDLNTWRNAVRTNLPQGSALISGDIRRGIDVTLMWFDKEYIADDTRTLRSTAVCTAATTGGLAQTCCPSTASQPAGVRCFNVTVMP
jgi:type IV pilus assembly protein PilV